MEPLDKIRKHVGRTVRRLRQDRKLTQAAFAKRLGVSQSRISDIERGEGSLSAEELITILTLFNTTLDDFVPSTSKPSVADELQNALARLGARHLLENSDVLPSERLATAHNVVRETLVLGHHPRLITGLAPVIVQHIDAINLHQINAELARLGLQRRLGWLAENTAEAVAYERPRAPRELTSKYRGASVILGNFLGLVAVPPSELPGNAKLGVDFLDRTIRSERTLAEVMEAASPISKRWRIATSIQPNDFATALRAAHASCRLIRGSCE